MQAAIAAEDYDGAKRLKTDIQRCAGTNTWPSYHLHLSSQGYLGAQHAGTYRLFMWLPRRKFAAGAAGVLQPSLKSGLPALVVSSYEATPVSSLAC